MERRLDPQRSTVDLIRQTVNRRNQPIPITALGTTIQTLYTAGPLLDFLIRQLWVAELGGVATTKVTIYLVPEGGTAGFSNMMFSNLALAANTTVHLPAVASDVLGTLMTPGSMLQAKCNGGQVNIGGWGQDWYGE